MTWSGRPLANRGKCVQAGEEAFCEQSLLSIAAYQALDPSLTPDPLLAPNG